MSKQRKSYLLALLGVLGLASFGFGASTKFTNVEVTNTLTVDGSQSVTGNETVTGNSTITGNATVTGQNIVARHSVTNVSTSTTVSPLWAFIVLTSTGGPVVMGTTPTISTTTASDGQFLVLKGTSSVATITLQDQGTLSGSLMELGASTRVISDLKVITLFFDSTVGKWLEAAYGNN